MSSLAHLFRWACFRETLMLSSVLFILPYVLSPWLSLLIFARPENYSTLVLYFLFFFLNERHSFWLRTSCYVGHMSKSLWLSFPHNLLDMLAVSSRYLSSLVTHAWWKLCNVIAVSLAFDNKCQTRITRNNTSNVSVTLSHCDSNCAAVLSEISSSVSLWFAHCAVLPTWFVFLHLLLACSVTFSRLFFLRFLFYF